MNRFASGRNSVTRGEEDLRTDTNLASSVMNQKRALLKDALSGMMGSQARKMAKSPDMTSNGAKLMSQTLNVDDLNDIKGTQLMAMKNRLRSQKNNFVSDIRNKDQTRNFLVTDMQEYLEP